MRAQGIPRLYFYNLTLKEANTKELIYNYLIKSYISKHFFNKESCISKKQLIANDEFINTFRFNYG
jgi:hypothetical protein